MMFIVVHYYDDFIGGGDDSKQRGPRAAPIAPRFGALRVDAILKRVFKRNPICSYTMTHFLRVRPIEVCMGPRWFSKGETIREIYASSYRNPHGVRVRPIEVRMGPRRIYQRGYNSAGLCQLL